MTHYGADLPAFLEAFEPAKALPYLADVARLEVLTRESLHAANATPAPEALAALPPERLAEARITFLPSMRLQTSRFPVLSIAEAALGNRSEGLPQGGEDLLFVRPDMTVTSHRLPMGGATFVSILSEGRMLGEAADAMPDGFDLPGTLTTLLTAQSITAATLP
jgi:hypothetical protein